ncbi:MAG: beta strand repeat-containing protein [Bacteroidia bacterium]
MTNSILQLKNHTFIISKWSTIKLLSVLILIFVVEINKVQSQTAYTMSLGNKIWDFADVTNWTNNFTSGTDAANWGSVAVNATGTIPDGSRTTVSSATFTTTSSGGVQKGVGNLYFLSTGTTSNGNAVAVDLNLNFTNRIAGTLTFDFACVFNSSGNRGGSLKVYTSTNGSTWTELTSAAVSVVNNVASSGTKSSISLPSAFNGSATAKIRFYQHSDAIGTTGSRPKISIDNVAVTSTPSTTAPLAPTMGTITPGDQQLTVAFTAGSDGGAAITNYEYSTNGGSSFTACSPTQTTSPMVITGLTNGTSYNVQIRAVNSVGSGTATSSTAATPYTNPAAPTINSITAGNTQLSVAFTAGNNGGSTITNYKYSTNGGSSFTACSPSQTTSPILITGLTNGTSYDIQILAVNIAGDGTASTTTSATPTAPVTPTISVSGPLSALSTTYGSPSSTTSFIVSGATLSDDILITPPAGYEISKTSNTTGFASTQTLTQSVGVVNSTTIYVRLAATTAVGASYDGDIVLSSSGVSPSITIATNTSIVNTRTLTISGLTGDNKNYDGGTSASVTGTASYAGLQNGETFSVATTPTYSFASKNIGTGITINQSVPFAAPSSNYTVTQPTLTANIAAINLTITGATVTSKNYDRLTTAVITGGTLNGIIGSETVNATTGTFIDKNVGTSKAVTVLLSGADAGNYTLTQPNVTGDINAIALTITSPAVTSKAFDGTTAATITGTLSGIISPDVVTLIGTGVFASSAQANGISVTSTSTLAGADAGNYILTQPTGLTGNITAAAPVLFAFTAGTAAITSGTPANLTISNLSSANNGGTVTLISSGTPSSGYTGASGTNNAGAAAVSGALNTATSTYFEFTLTPTSGYYVTLSSISFGSRCTGTGPTNFAVRSSADGYSTNVATGTLTTNSTWALYNPTVTSTSSLGSAAITFRIYGYSGTGNTTIVWRIDDLSLGLTVTQMGTNNWLGTSDNLWNNAANWSAGVPNGYNNILISSSDVVLNTNHTIYIGTSFTLSGTSSLTINPTKILTIAGTADFGGKLVTLKSDDTGSGAIGQISGTLNNATNINVERYIPAFGFKRYRFLSSPVSTTVADWRNEIFITGGGASNEFSQVGINNIKSNGLDWTLSGAPSMFEYSENLNSGNLNSRWVAITNASNSLIPGKGYRTYIRGNRSNSGVLDNSVTSQSAVTITSVGTLNQGTFTLPTTYNGAGDDNGWNLIGNPYPSTIDWSSTTGWTKTNISSNIYVYNPSSNTYGSYDGLTGTNGVTRYISSGQGFFIRTTGASPILSCTESVKSVNTGAALFKTENANTLRIKLVKDINNYDETVIRFYEGKENEFSETDDVRKFMNSTLNVFSTLGDSQNLAVNYLNPNNLKNSIVKLSAIANELGNYQLNFSGINSFLSTPYISLKDNYLNTKIDLKAKETYSFDITNDINSNKDGRFEISFTENLNSNVENSSDEVFINVYPNPVNDILNINIGISEKKNYSFTIYNATGVEILKGKLTKNNNQINTENWNSGVYIININSQFGNPKSIKFIK